VIFLGAGASAPFGIPTTAVLTSEVMRLLEENHLDLLTEFSNFWKGVYEKAPNYENLLTILMGLTNPRSIPRDSIAQAFVKEFPKFKQDYTKIVDDIYSRIVEYCTAPFSVGSRYLDPTKLEEIFQLTYDILTLFHDQTIFTTNYDPSLEIWCQKRNILLHDLTKPIANPEIREILPLSEKSVAIGQTSLYPDRGQQELSLKVVRLHGSVWVYETKGGRKVKMTRPHDKLLFTDWYDSFKSRPYMIFPGQESTLSHGEWDINYQYFKRKLQGNCLVIGYSFQDDLINQVFLDSLKMDRLRKVGVLDPDPETVISNLSWHQQIPRKKIVSMSSEFGTADALNKLVTNWVQRVLRRTFVGGRFGQRIENARQKMRSYLD